MRGADEMFDHEEIKKWEFLQTKNEQIAVWIESIAQGRETRTMKSIEI